MKKYVILTLFVIICTHVFSQKKHDWSYENRSKFFLSFGMGGNIPLHSPSSITGNLIANGSSGPYLQAFSATFFAYKKWGIELSIRPDIPNYSDSLQFQNKLEALYQNKYFVSTATSVYNGGNTNGSIMAGPVYKITKGRFMVVPKFLFGINLISASDGYVMLKEKNGNEIIDMKYIPTHDEKAAFAISPAVSFSYRVAKTLGVNIDVNYSWYKPSFSYSTSSYNYATQNKIDNFVKTSIVVQKISIGAGISLLIR